MTITKGLLARALTSTTVRALAIGFVLLLLPSAMWAQATFTCPAAVTTQVDGGWLNNFRTPDGWATGRRMSAASLAFERAYETDFSCHSGLWPQDQDKGCLVCAYEHGFQLQRPKPNANSCAVTGKLWTCTNDALQGTTVFDVPITQAFAEAGSKGYCFGVSRYNQFMQDAQMATLKDYPNYGGEMIGTVGQSGTMMFAYPGGEVSPVTFHVFLFTGRICTHDATTLARLGSYTCRQNVRPEDARTVTLAPGWFVEEVTLLAPSWAAPVDRPARGDRSLNTVLRVNLPVNQNLASSLNLRLRLRGPVGGRWQDALPRAGACS